MKEFFCLALCAILIAPGAPAAAQNGARRLTVGYTPLSGTTLPFFMAVEEKTFQRYGLEVSPVFMGGPALINSAILAGEFPIGYTNGVAIVSSRLAGSDLIAIASPVPLLTVDGWSRPEIKSIGDLRGKRVGVARFGASSHMAGLLMLKSAGLKASEVIFIQTGGIGELLVALMTGKVDAAMIDYPFGLKAKDAGFRLLFRPSQTEYGLFPTAVVAARESWLRLPDNRRLAVDFLRALNEGLLLAREDAIGSKRALQKYTRIQDEVALRVSFDYFREAFPGKLKVVEKAMTNALELTDHPKAGRASVTQFFDNRLLDEAMK
jgi:ABC-type nitrate/sulfonate/bicarbonate transport system substrate-binding protein